MYIYMKRRDGATPTGRCEYLDYAKAIAIILMVLLHTTSRYSGLSNIIGSFHMAVFFIIGGVFFNINGRSFVEILKKGIIQLIIPYFVFSICALAICWISPYLHPELYPGLDSFSKIFRAAVIGIFVGQDYYSGYSFMPLGPLWFLLSLFWCRLLSYFWIKTSPYIWIRRVVILGLLVSIYIYHPLILSLDGMAVSFPFFVIGYYTGNFFKNIDVIKLQYKIVLAVICLAVLCVFTDSQLVFGAGRIVGNHIIAYSRGLAGSMALIVICTFIHHIPRVSVWLSLLGASTITVLGLHFHFIFPAKVIYKLTHGDPGSIHIVYALVVSILTVLCLTYVHRFLSTKVPFAVGKGRVKRLKPCKYVSE